MRVYTVLVGTDQSVFVQLLGARSTFSLGGLGPFVYRHRLRAKHFPCIFTVELGKVLPVVPQKFPPHWPCFRPGVLEWGVTTFVAH